MTGHIDFRRRNRWALFGESTQRREKQEITRASVLTPCSLRRVPRVPNAICPEDPRSSRGIWRLLNAMKPLWNTNNASQPPSRTLLGAAAWFQSGQLSMTNMIWQAHRPVIFPYFSIWLVVPDSCCILSHCV